MLDFRSLFHLQFFFLMVTICVKRSWHLICYQVSGELSITGCDAVTVSSCRSDIYLGRCGRVRAKPIC